MDSSFFALCLAPVFAGFFHRSCTCYIDVCFFCCRPAAENVKIAKGDLAKQKVRIVVQWQSPVFELHLILGHNRCFFAFSGKVHPTNEKSA